MRKTLPLFLLLALALTGCGGNSLMWDDAGDYDASDAKYKLDSKGRSTVAESVIADKYEDRFDPAWGEAKKTVKYEDLIDDFGDDYGMDTTVVEYTFTDISKEEYASLDDVDCTDGNDIPGEKNLASVCSLMGEGPFESSLKIQAFSYQDIMKDGSTETIFSFEYDPRYED